MILRNIILSLLCCALTSAYAETSPSTLKNNVAHHDSPYLAMHGTDPIKWQAWSKDVLKLARQENKLIFMSIGYFSCYWCHVMQKESFIDPDIAKVLNKHFIPVIVDRELNPALDAHLVDFMEKYRGSAGWPMNIFLTPEGYPLIGSLYAPQQQFLDLLVKLVERWQVDGEKLKTIARQVAKTQLQILSTDPIIKKGTGEIYSTSFFQHAMQLADELAGGFGDKSKFPMPAQLLALLDSYEKTPSKPLEEFLKLTLDNMANQGLRDHLDGGFFRYTVDPTWQIPHFEKMLYDNALLSSIFLRASNIFNNEYYTNVATDTLKFMINRFSSADGAMVSSFSAVDEEGIEGAYYVWTNEVLNQLLSPQELKIIKFTWDMQGEYPVEEGYIPVNAYTTAEVAAHFKMNKKELSRLFEQAKLKLANARNKRHLPVDTKFLAAWNGLALSALSQASKQFDDGYYKNKTEALQRYIVTHFWTGDKLHRAISNANPLGDGKLEDYAYVSAGLYEYAQLSGNKKDYQLAREILQAGWKRFFNSSGWHLTDDLILPIETGEIVLDDRALPSASAIMIDISLKLAQRFNDEKLKQQALAALNNGHEIIRQNPFSYASTISVFAKLEEE